MAIVVPESGVWVLDKSAHVRWAAGAPLPPGIDATRLAKCEVGTLEWLYSARSASDYDAQAAALADSFTTLQAPPDIVERVLRLQADLAHHHGLWHRMAIPDLFIAETALFHGAGVLHQDGDYERIGEVRRRLAHQSLKGDA